MHFWEGTSTKRGWKDRVRDFSLDRDKPFQQSFADLSKQYVNAGGVRNRLSAYKGWFLLYQPLYYHAIVLHLTFSCI